MRTLLVHVDEFDGLEALLTSALHVARRFGSHVEGLYVRPGIPRMVPIGPEGAGLATTELIEGLEREERHAGKRVRARFDAFMREQEVPLSARMPASDRASASFGELVSAGDEGFASRGRAFDLLVVGRPVEARSGPRLGSLEAALFESGRPVLVTPSKALATLGKTIVVAWNGSTETARTLAGSMSFLSRAEDVLVLGVEEGMVSGPSAREVAENLAHNDVPARARQFACGSRAGVGAAILEACAELGADLLLKGAYTQSRFRQMIFGGATSHILANAELPVLMAH